MRTKTKEGFYSPATFAHEVLKPIRGNTYPVEVTDRQGQGRVYNGGETITYATGPKYTHGITSLNWKTCQHSGTSKVSGRYCSYAGFQPNVYGRYRWWDSTVTYPGSLNDYTPRYRIPDIDPQLEQTLIDEIFANIDLNCSESVMCYSAVLQAIPLVGSAVKIGSILNAIGRDLKRSWRRKPFTTVIKSLISADFINRFVVQTTIQDMHMVANATNYVLDTIKQAIARNGEEYTVLEATKTLKDEKESTPEYFYPPAGTPLLSQLPITVSYGTDVTMKVKWIAKLRYNTDIIDPVKLWAARVGLTKPLESFWDMVPFSFVVDYFLRTGEFLSELSNEMSSQDGLRGLVCSMGRPWKMTKAASYSLVTNEALYRSRIDTMDGRETFLNVFSGRSRRETFSFTREPIYDWDQSTFWNRGGLWAPQLSSTRVRTMGQLWLQAKI